MFVVLEEIVCLASLGAAALAGRVLSPALPTIRWRAGGAGIRPMAPASARAPYDGTESPITFNMLLTFRVTGQELVATLILVMAGACAAIPIIGRCALPLPYWDRGRLARSFFAELRSGR